MATYAFRGRSGGAVVSGEIEANDRPAAVTALRARGVVATSVQERTAKPVGIKNIGGKVKDKDLAIYTRQFSTMVDAGLPIAQCLSILAEQSDSKVLRDVTGKIAREVEGGVTLAESFRKYPKVFTICSPTCSRSVSPAVCSTSSCSASPSTSRRRPS